MRNYYTEDQKKEALDYYAKYGAAEASRRLAIPAGTIASWASRAGVASVLGESAEIFEAMRAEKTRMAQMRMANLENELSEIAELAMQRTIAALDDEDASPRLSEIVGAWTRAIHDLRLLRGESTSKTEIEDTTDRAARLAERIDELAERRNRAQGLTGS